MLEKLNTYLKLKKLSVEKHRFYGSAIKLMIKTTKKKYININNK